MTSLQGQVVVHGAEDRFLHLAAVLGAADQDHSFVEVHEDEDIGVGLVMFEGMEARDSR